MRAIDRANNYVRAFPDYPPLQVSGEKLYGMWLIGNNYKRINPLYGSYPNSFLERIYALFPETPRLHVFSGGVIDGRGTTFDSSPDRKADVVGDVMDIGSLLPFHRYNTVIADPPYNDKARKIYGTPSFNKRLAVKEISKVVAPGGFLIWLDTTTPMWSKKEWSWRGCVGLHTGTNCVMRVISILKRNYITIMRRRG